MRKILLIMIGLSVGLMAEFVRDAGTQIVTDTATGLQWQDNTGDYTTWEGAIDYCEALDLGGKQDWRLPNINELRSLAKVSTFNPAISSVFVNYKDGMGSNLYVWSSTTNSSATDSAWMFWFGNGKYSNSVKRSNTNVRCVRAGQ